MLDALSKPFLALSELEKVREEIKKGSCNLQITGCIDSGLVHMMKLVSDNSVRKIILTFSEQKAREIYEDMKFFDKATYYYPSKDFIFYSAGFKGKQLVAERMRVLKALIEQEQATIVTTLDALMDKLAPLSVIKDSSIIIDYDSIIDLDAFTIKLVSMGYEKVDQVEMPGQFAVRGSILDIYSLIEELPFRIDLWDDTIDSIKSFDPTSQRTVENLESISIYPATEFVLSNTQLTEGMDKIRAEAKEYGEALRKDMKTEEAHRISTTINELLDSLEYSPTSVTIDSYVNYFNYDVAIYPTFVIGSQTANWQTKENETIQNNAKECVSWGDGTKIFTFPYEIGTYEKLPLREWLYHPGRKTPVPY